MPNDDTKNVKNRKQLPQRERVTPSSDRRLEPQEKHSLRISETGGMQINGFKIFLFTTSFSLLKFLCGAAYVK